MKTRTDIYSTILVLFLSIGLLTGATIKDREQVTINRTVTETQLPEVEEYHESDNLIARTDTGIQYLNETGTEADTIYLYTIKKQNP